MGWFGKKNISARDASVQFVEATMIATIQQWPTLVTHLREGLLADTTFLDDRWTQFEFAMAAMVIQAQAVENLISAEAAARVKQHMRDSLGAVEETGEAAIDAFDAYEYAVARASVTMNMFPDEIAILLCHRCNAPRVASNPLSISVLSLELIQVNLG